MRDGMVQPVHRHLTATLKSKEIWVGRKNVAFCMG